MKLESEFVIDAPDVRVFDNFLDPDVLGPCIPGCESLKRVNETHYTGVIVNEVAHVKFRAAFSVEIAEMSRPHKVVAVMAGEDSRLASSLKVDAALNVAARDEGSANVRYEMNVVLWGKLGRMGEAIIRRKTVDIEREFVKRFTAACGADGGSVPSVSVTSAGTAGVSAPQHAAPAAAGEAQPAHRPAGDPAAALAAPSGPGRPAPANRQVSWWRRLTNWILGKRSGR